MYKAVFKIQPECIDLVNNKIHTPFINCYTIHSAYMFVNGFVYQLDVDFEFEDHYTKWQGDFSIDREDQIILELNYFYMRSDNDKILNFITNNSSEYTQPDTTNEIMSKHYREGQFSLDNGLYKNAALNFGTTLEAMLNKSFSTTILDTLINEYRISESREYMHYIRLLRNKVHPNRIVRGDDISRRDATIARNYLEIILKTFNSI